MSEGTQNLQQQTQDQYLQQAQTFFGQTMGRIKGRMQSDSAQLEGLMPQLPEEAQAQIQEMTDSYAQFEDIIDRSAQDAGVQEVMDEEAEQARQSADEASGQGQGPVDQAADQAQDMVGGVAEEVQDGAAETADQAQEALEELADGARQMAESLPEGYEPVGEPTTDEEGNPVLQAQDEQGNIVTVKRGEDPEGNVVDQVYDPQGNLMDEVVRDNPLPVFPPQHLVEGYDDAHREDSYSPTGRQYRRFGH